MRAGGRARLVGLRAREDLNGVEVALLSFTGDRWAVRCVLSTECIRIKPANLEPVPGLHERLSGNESVNLVLRQCDGPTLRTVRATNRRLVAQATRMLQNSAWTQHCNLTRLAAWQASSPVYGFYTYRDRSPKISNTATPGALSRTASGALVAHAAVHGANGVAGVDLWNSASGCCVGAATLRDMSGAPVAVDLVTMSADGRLMAVGSRSTGSVGVFEIVSTHPFTAAGSSAPAENPPPQHSLTQRISLHMDGVHAMALGGGRHASTGRDTRPPWLLCAGEDVVAGGLLRMWRIQPPRAHADGLGDDDVAHAEGCARAWEATLELTRDSATHVHDAIAGRSVLQSMRPLEAAPDRAGSSSAVGSAHHAATAGGESNDDDSLSFACATRPGGRVLLISPSAGAAAGASAAAQERWLTTSHARGLASVALLSPFIRAANGGVLGASGHGVRVVCAGHDQRLTVWSARSGACMAVLDYAAAIRAMPWVGSLGSYEKEHYKPEMPLAGDGAGDDASSGGDDGSGMQDLSDDEEGEGGGALVERGETVVGGPLSAHRLSVVDGIGESMLATGDRGGCICVWGVSALADDQRAPDAAAKKLEGMRIGERGSGGADGGEGGGEIRLVAVLPPTDEGSDDGSAAIRGVAIVDAEADDVAGGGLVFSDGRGGLTKMIPVGKRDLLSLE